MLRNREAELAGVLEAGEETRTEMREVQRPGLIVGVWILFSV